MTGTTGGASSSRTLRTAASAQTRLPHVQPASIGCVTGNPSMKQRATKYPSAANQNTSPNAIRYVSTLRGERCHCAKRISKIASTSRSKTG
jgi:hypothetical protein